MDCSLPGFSVHGILQARILEWVAMSSSRGIFPTQGWNPCLFCLLHWQAGSLTLAPPGKCLSLEFSSVQFSRSVRSDSLQPHEPQHIRPPCPSPTPGVHPNSCPLSWWCHPTISSSVVPFSSCPQSFPASGSFQMSQLFTSGGKNIGVSASPSVLPMNLRMDWLDLLAVILKQIWRPHIVSLRNTSKINNFVQDIWT